jgi:hypothetical protein
MSARTLVVVALVGAAAFAVWRLWPEPERHPNAGSADAKGVESGEPQESVAEPPAAGDPDAPARPAMPPAPTRMRATGDHDDDGDGAGDRHAISDEFAAEPRNAEWATPREAEVNRRAQEIVAAAAREAPPGATAVTAGKSECRAHTCRLKLSAGDTASLARTLEWLGDPRGFAGSAEDMLVEAVEKADDGPRVVNVFLRYAR